MVTKKGNSQRIYTKGNEKGIQPPHCKKSTKHKMMVIRNEGQNLSATCKTDNKMIEVSHSLSVIKASHQKNKQWKNAQKM